MKLEYENEALRLDVEERIDGNCCVCVMFVNTQTLTLRVETEESDEDENESNGASDAMRE